MEEPKHINFKDNNTRPKGRRSAPKAEDRQTGKPEPYAYTFEDANLGTMPVLNSANGWWAGTEGARKLTKLVDAYKFYATDDQACYYAGITTGQLQYFQELHPNFFGIKHAAKQSPALLAKKKLIGDIEKDGDVARWFLERAEKETFSPRVENAGANGRDLFDGLSQEIRQLGEALRNEDATDSKEHPGVAPTGDAHAGPGGAGDATAPTGAPTEGPALPA